MADGAKPNPADLGARAAIRAMAAGELQASDLVAACLERIGDDPLRAWVHVDRDGALRAAAALDAHRRRGLPLGPLHGLPVGVKDIIDVAGMPGENGSPVDAGRVPRADATVVRRLRGAGAIVLGKTVTTELAGAPPSHTVNPHDATRTPGGSSAGSAVAVAAGHVPLALGTQTNGSVIRPASFCGTVGYKPSFGAIPRTGVLGVSTSLDHIGLFARETLDATLLEHLAGPDGEDDRALPHGLPLAATAAGAPPLPPVLGFFEGPTWSAAEPYVAEAFSELTAAIPGTVHHLATPSALAEIAALIRIVMVAEGTHLLGHYVARGGERTDPHYHRMVADAATLPATEYLRARALQPRLAAAMGEIFEEVDALLTPAAAGEAPGPETTGNPAFCSLWSFTGLPAITLPLLTGPSGLPVGVQLVGPPGDDARLIRTARWLVASLRAEGDPS
ncbi:MAG: amidase [Pseudomonadota bacterium]